MIRTAVAVVLAVVTAGSVGQNASARVVKTIKLEQQGAEPRYPSRIGLGPSGALYVLDSGDRGSSPVRMSVYTRAGRLLRRWRIATDSSLVPNMVVDAAGNTYVVAARPVPPATLEYSILKHAPTGRLLSARWAGRAWDARSYPVLATDGQGRVLVAYDGLIETFDAAGQVLASWRYLPPGDNNNQISGLAVATSGAIYVADRKGIAMLNSAGKVVSRIAPAGRGIGQASFASLIAGPADTVYTVQEQRIQKFGPDGRFLGAVGRDRHVQWLSAAVAADGSLYVPQNRYGGVSGVVVKLAPITTVDVTPPSITVKSFSGPPNTHGATTVLGRLTYRLSEDASFRISVHRRSSRKGHRDYGRYLHLLTLDKKVTPAGTHRLTLRLPRKRRFSAGRYHLTLIARDDAGSESKPARVRFEIARP